VSGSGMGADWLLATIVVELFGWVTHGTQRCAETHILPQFTFFFIAMKAVRAPSMLIG